MDLLPNAQNSETPDAATLVLGLGSALRGDDAVGLMVIRAMRAHPLPARTHLLAAGTAGLELVLEMMGQSNVFVIDAARFGAEPGEVRCFDLLTCELATANWGSGHAQGLAAAIELSRALGMLPQRLWLFAVEPFGVELNQPLSAPVQRAVPVVVSGLLAALGVPHGGSELTQG